MMKEPAICISQKYQMGLEGAWKIPEFPDSNRIYILESKTDMTENLTWRILGINESRKIELISENSMSDVNDVYLANEEGYLYLETKDNIKGTLDTMCDRLYGNEIGAECKYKFLSASEVTGTRKIQYIKNSGSRYSNNCNNITANEYVKFRLPGAEPETELNSINTGISPELFFIL